MSKRRIALALTLGLVLAVFVSACGVALGPVQFTAGGPAVTSPAWSGLSLPGLFARHPAATMGSMAHNQQLTSTSPALSLHAFGVGCHELP